MSCLATPGTKRTIKISHFSPTKFRVLGKEKTNELRMNYERMN